jgi:hypothetical protein
MDSRVQLSNFGSTTSFCALFRWSYSQNSNMQSEMEFESKYDPNKIAFEDETSTAKLNQKEAFLFHATFNHNDCKRSTPFSV